MKNYRKENGKEYYRDISREKTPNWIGWKIIDDYKERYGFFQECHDKCGDLEFYYKQLKNKNYG